MISVALTVSGHVLASRHHGQSQRNVKTRAQQAALMSVDFVIQGVSVARSSAGELNETVRLLNSLSAGSLGVSAAAATHAAKLVHGGAPAG